MQRKAAVVSLNYTLILSILTGMLVRFLYQTIYCKCRVMKENGPGVICEYSRSGLVCASVQSEDLCFLYHLQHLLIP